MNNLFKNIPNDLKEELFESIIENESFKLEKIISEAHASPPNFWYDQDKREFVLLLQGNAQLSFQDGEIVKLNPGDYFIIEKHRKHRVDWTSAIEKTVWLALHY